MCVGMCTPSQKVKIIARGTGAVGTAGLGFVVVNPGSSQASNGNGISVTGSTFAGTTFASSGTGITQYNADAPYTAAQINGDENTISVRLINAAVRITSTANAMVADGVHFAYCEPNHHSVVGQTGVQLMTYGAEIGPNARNSASAKYIACGGTSGDAEDELAFGSYSFTNNEYSLVAGILGTAGQGFLWEYVAHVEYTGQPVQSRLTATRQDPLVGPFIIQAAATAPIAMSNAAMTPAVLEAVVQHRLAEDVSVPIPSHAGGGWAAHWAAPFSPTRAGIDLVKDRAVSLPRKGQKGLVALESFAGALPHLRAIPEYVGQAAELAALFGSLLAL